MPLSPSFDGVHVLVSMLRAFSGLRAAAMSARDASLIKIAPPAPFWCPSLRPVMFEYACDISVLVESQSGIVISSSIDRLLRLKTPLFLRRSVNGSSAKGRPDIFGRPICARE